MMACRRRSASSASRASAWASARTWAAKRRWPSMSVRTAASLVSVSRLGGNSSSAAAALSCALSASARSALRRLCASVSADFRAAWRLISRSAWAWRSRAASASRWAARQASRAEPSAEEAAFSAASAVSSAWRLAEASMRACSSSFSISTSRARSASRRAAPVGAWAAATKPSQRQTSPSGDTSRWPVFSCDTSSAPRSLGTTPIWARRRASSIGASTCAASGSTPSGSAGSPSVTPELVQRIGADGSTGASRSSPSAAPIAFS